MAADDTLLPPETIREKLAEVIVYCNAGVSASFNLLAMRVAGLHNGTLYDGSWKDWGNDDSKPIADL